MMRILWSGIFAALLFLSSPVSAPAQTTTTNASAFPLTGDVLLPAQPNRLAVRCFNPLTNHAAIISYVSSDGSLFTFTLQPGGTLWETAPGSPNNLGTGGAVPLGIIKATGTSTETLPCQVTTR